MTRKQRYNLVNIIYKDLCMYGKMQLFLLFSILVSAMLVITVTYYTRCMIINREELLLETRFLDTEWNRLILKEKKLSNHSRVESIAINSLHMHYIDVIKDDIQID